MRGPIISILLATVWISISEFVRNQLFLVDAWNTHYDAMGQVFPTEPINGAMWGVWSLVFAVTIYVISRKFTFIETVALSWVYGFLMMWIVIGNLNAMPLHILTVAVPLSIVEVAVATWIVQRIGS